MAYTVEVRDAADVVLLLFTTTPFVSPSEEHGHDEDEQPPRYVWVKKTWRLRGKLYGATEAATAAAWAALKAAVQTAANPPRRVRLLRDAAQVEDIRAGAAADRYDDFRVEALRSPESERQWRSEMDYELVVSGRQKHFGVVEIHERTTREYDERGLLTLSLEGEMLTRSDTDVETQMQGRGIAAPGIDFVSLTNGPNNVSYVVLDRAKTRGTYRSAWRQLGAQSSGNNVEPLSASVTLTRADGFETRVVTVSARGRGAEAAVRAERPGDYLASESITVDAIALVASAVYVQRRPVGGARRVVRRRVFARAGGGRGIAFTALTGDAPPAKHRLERAPVTIVETGTIEVTGDPSANDFRLPGAVFRAEDEDTAAFTCTYPDRVIPGAQANGALWRMHYSRTYKFSTLAGVDDPVFAAVFSEDLGTTLAEQTARQAEA